LSAIALATAEALRFYFVILNAVKDPALQ